MVSTAFLIHIHVNNIFSLLPEITAQHAATYMSHNIQITSNHLGNVVSGRGNAAKLYKSQLPPEAVTIITPICLITYTVQCIQYRSFNSDILSLCR